MLFFHLCPVNGAENKINPDCRLQFQERVYNCLKSSSCVVDLGFKGIQGFLGFSGCLGFSGYSRYSGGFCGFWGIQGFKDIHGILRIQGFKDFKRGTVQSCLTLHLNCISQYQISGKLMDGFPMKMYGQHMMETSI